MNDQTSVGKRLQKLEIGPEFDAYTRVIIHAGQTTDAQGNTKDRDFIAGNTSGRTMEITDPLGTQAKANALLAKLRNSAWQYQPYNADSALLDPAAELGDGVTVSDEYSAIYNRDVTYSSLMAANIAAPSDEEIDHEFPYIPKADREYKRETAFTRSQLKINANEISAEVSRASAAEGNLSSRITVNANAISTEVTNRQTAVNNLNTTLTSKINQTSSAITAEVSRATTAEGTKLNHTNTNQAFGWALNSTAFLLKNNNTTVFQFDKDGLRFKSGGTDVFTVTRTGGLYVKGNGEFTGKVTASSGYIGNGSSGFEIGSTYIRNGMTGMTDTTHNGIFLGTNGIALGKGNFTVTNAGALTAKSGTIGGITLNSSYGLYTNGKASSTSTATGFLISKSGAIYLGAYDSTKKACPFQVTAAGAVTASNINITGGSISIKNGSTETFKVTSVGKVTASDLNITGGTISIKDGTTEKFKVTSKGEVTAANLKITGGTISIGTKFKVDSDGTVTATALKFNGGSITIGSKFSVTSTGTVTATGGEIGGFSFSGTSFSKSTPDVSTNGQSQYQLLLYAPSTISTSNGAIYLRHRVYNNGGYGNWINDFRVGYDGSVTASNLSITGGSINIDNKFKVTSSGSVTATALTFTGGSISIGNNFSVTSGGLMTAKSGYIGNGSSGFEIGNTYIRNGMQSMYDTEHNGIYLGTNGIALGKGNFKVDSSGNITAKNANLSGTLTIDGTSITAYELRVGAQQSYDNYSGWNGTTATVNDGYSGWNSAAVSTSYGGYCYGGASDGYSAYSRVLSAYIGNYQLQFGSGITILGANFTDSNGGRCSGSASNSAVVTCTYIG